MPSSSEIRATLCLWGGCIRLLTSALTASLYRRIGHVLKPPGVLIRGVTSFLKPGDLITEALTPSINTQAAVEHLFAKILPRKVKALSKWKSIDIQRIHPHDTDYRRISNYLTKQITPEHLSLDPFSSDLTNTCNRTRNAK